jgi:uncharacterized membrane protein YuzA (DUF378 family)
MVVSVTRFLVTAAAINWGLIGFGAVLGGTGWNLVHMLFDSWARGEAYFYVLVGFAGVHQMVLYTLPGCKGGCCK